LTPIIVDATLGDVGKSVYVKQTVHKDTAGGSRARGRLRFVFTRLASLIILVVCFSFPAATGHPGSSSAVALEEKIVLRAGYPAGIVDKGILQDMRISLEVWGSNFMKRTSHRIDTVDALLQGIFAFRRDLEASIKSDVGEALGTIHEYPYGQQILMLIKEERLVLFKPENLDAVRALLKSYEQFRRFRIDGNRTGVTRNGF
jgi:hypothetical protein